MGGDWAGNRAGGRPARRAVPLAAVPLAASAAAAALAAPVLAAALVVASAADAERADSWDVPAALVLEEAVADRQLPAAAPGSRPADPAPVSPLGRTLPRLP